MKSSIRDVLDCVVIGKNAYPCMVTLTTLIFLKIHNIHNNIVIVSYFFFFTGSYDFLCFNYYFSFLIRPMSDEEYNRTTELQKKDIGLVGTWNEHIFNDVNIKIYRHF